MRNSADGIQTSHAGSLPRTKELIDANALRAEGADLADFDQLQQAQVTDVVRRQVEAGITVPGDGEYGKAMTAPVDYGAWWSYSFQRLGGLELDESWDWVNADRKSSPGNVVLTGFAHRRDRQRFADAYNDPTSGIWTGGGRSRPFPKCTGPLTYTGHDQIAADIKHFKAALAANDVDEGFMTSLSPGSCSRITNDYYDSDDEFLDACADAMRQEYQAIIEAGLILQIDDPSIAENFDQIDPEPSIDDYLAFTRKRVDALNRALAGLPTDRIRFHLCWGSWHGPHTTDIAMADIVATMLSINAGAYSFEAGNVRHEHEWKVWRDVQLPAGKLILPGVVSHATNVVEHPELVADRIERFADAVGRENVIASSDCGLGGRVHPQIAWAKLQTLGAGARLATERLWR